MDWFHSDFKKCMDPGLPLAAADAYVPHLATRAWIHTPDRIDQPNGSLVSCVILDPSVSNYVLDEKKAQKIGRELDQLGFRPVYSCRQLTVFQQGNDPCLRCEPVCR